jgi:hypothetical protein
MSGVDYCGQAGANTLADRIRAYWRARGCEVTTRFEILEARRDSIVCVRSNLVGGLSVAVPSKLEDLAA